VKATKILAAAALTIGMASSASAAVIFNPGTTVQVAGVSDFEVLGDEMAGMLITATFIRSDGSLVSITEAWDPDFDSAADHGGVVFSGGSNDIDLEVEGDTFDNGVWDLDFTFAGTGVRLLELSFDGLSGNTVFDRCWAGTSQSTNCNNDDGIEGTPGSNVGKTFADFNELNSNQFTATYLNAVGVGGNAPVGDIFANFILRFGNGTYGQALPEGGGDDSGYNFSLDTDIVRQNPPAVPEPGSMLLLGSGLVGLVARMRRKKQ
jgi:hypothetical protein